MRMTLMAKAPVLLILAACSGGGTADDEGGSQNGIEASPTSSPVAAPLRSPAPQFPPLEEVERVRSVERTNYSEHPDFQFPNPTDLPVPSIAQAGAEFHPPQTPECPTDWEILVRVSEKFQICYPSDWEIDGSGYVTEGVDEKWYALGIFRFTEEGYQSAHVSVYMTGAFSQPFTYVITCDQAYQVSLAGEPASLCPDHDGKFPEAKIIAYHVASEEGDYFIQVVPYFEVDPSTGDYLQTWSKEDEETAIRIAQSFRLL